MKKLDYYEFLQISPNAEEETIHRVYRFLAARYHPDNPITGDADQFAILTRAYEVLSDPVRRAQYDIAREHTQAAPLSNSVDFMDQMDGETNRRLALLAVLYYRRRTNPNAPEVTLAEVETRMGFPRDYLDFTTWYLQKKGYISKADNSDFALTADGVDFVETQRVNIPILNKLLTQGEAAPASQVKDKAQEAAREEESLPAPTEEVPVKTAASGKGKKRERRATKSDRRANPVERREATQDRRQGKPDWRANPIERRMSIVDRRRSATDRRLTKEDRRAGSDSAAETTDVPAQE